MNENLKIIYLAGWGRSGSTLLSNLLGEVKGLTSIGETYNLWRRGMVEDKLCGCEKPFSACDYWQTIMHKAFGDMACLDGEYFQGLQERVSNRDLLVKVLFGSPVQQDHCVQEYAYMLKRLYTAVAQTSNSRVIVDSSKIPSHAYLLNDLEGIDLYIVHLVRDPRAVAYSWMKKKRYDPNSENVTYMDRFNPAISTLIWMYWNVLIESIWGRSPRYYFLRYEDLLEKPRLALEEILGLIQGEAGPMPAIQGDSIYLHPNHNVSGNPSRFRRGWVKLERDDVWRKKLFPGYQALVNLLSFPLLKRYGYT
jgi:hypothetical protein